MVNVTHNADNGRSCCHLALVLFFLFQKFFNHIDFYFFFTDNFKFDGNIFRIFKAYLRIHGHNLSLHEKLLDNNGWLDFHLIRQFLNCQRIRKRNDFNLFLHNRLRLFLRFNKASGFIAILYTYFILFVN